METNMVKEYGEAIKAMNISVIGLMAGPRDLEYMYGLMVY